MVTTGEQAVKIRRKKDWETLLETKYGGAVDLRPYRPADLDAVAALFYAAVHGTCRKDYTPEQLAAWATGEIDRESWNASLLAHITLVAEWGGRIAGFGDLDGGYLDRLYVHPDFQRRGVAAAICGALESHARARGAGEMETHASVTARPFFASRGYETVREQRVERRGVLLTNYVMRKRF